MREQSQKESGEQQEQLKKRKTVAELLAEHAESLMPTEGDKAYTVYGGREYVGVLKCDERDVWVIVPAEGKKYFPLHEGEYATRGPGKAAYRAYTDMDIANVSVYAPNEYNMDTEETDKSMKEFDPGITKKVQYDKIRGMFYLRAHED